MRFESIKINNYRQYKSLTVNFNEYLKNDLHIVVASNGVGKTNLLNAINWCLYGDEPHLANGDESLSICNLQSLDEAKEIGETSCNVSVEVIASTNDKSISFYREKPVNTTTLFAGAAKLKVTIICDSGKTEIFEENSAVDVVNQYLPEKIREYFFFDGERLDNYFVIKKAGVHIKDSIHEIAQVHVMTKIKNTLNKVAKEEYQGNISKINPKIDEISKRQTDVIMSLENNQREYIQLKDSIQLSNEVILKCDEKIAGTGSIVEDNRRYNEYTEEVKRLKEKKEKIKNEMQAFVRKYTFLLNTYSINAATYKFIDEKNKKGILPPDIDIKLLLKSVDEHKCIICNQDIDDKTEKYVRDLIDKIELSSEVSHKLVEIKNDVFSAIENTKHYKEEKKELLSRSKEIEDRVDYIENEMDMLFERISTCSDIKGIEEFMEEKKHNLELLQINNKKLGKIEEQIEKSNHELEDIEKELKKALCDSDKCDELRLYLLFSNRAAQIVTEIEQEIMDEVRMEMEKETMNLFNQLIWKTHTYSHIELDSNYKLKLFHQKTNASCLGSCSAAERSLLALAFTIALHKVSGHEGLLFIDTPVARVSDVNRENFAKVLIEASKSKQIIMMFTPSEYSTEISMLFDSFAASKVKLQTDEETTIKEEVFAYAR